ncbi:MAG TPA: GAF domain-containing protein, partial [Burkholderiales bacterium]|nr:GAF domain-containing protein [Burkholderiales bacterium]
SRFADDIEYELEGTPCEHVIKEGRACFYPADLIERFPKEVDSGMQSYFGLPIFDADARVIGHLAFFDDKPMHEGLIVDAVYRIFTARAGAELSRRRVEHAVSDLVLALSEASGAACFRVLVEHFSRLMGAREAFVTECVDGMEPALRVLAWWRDGRHESEQEYSLAQSVCEETIRDGKICVYPDHVGDRFPRARPLDREAYVGVPCFDSSGDVLGHIACCYDQALRRVIPDEPVLKLFAQRAALELEKRRLFTRGAARTSTVSV